MKKTPHVIWVCPSSHLFFRSKGEVKTRPGSVIPKLAEKGMQINVLIPHDPTLLPKTKLASGRVSRPTLKLAQDYTVEVTKLTRGSISPGVYMVKLPHVEPALSSALFAKTAIALAQQIRKPVDIFHVFDWEGSLLPLFLEMENGNKLFKDARTFLNVQSLREQGNFAPAVLGHLGLPDQLFHPDGIEFYGKVSFLKSGLIFSDGVGLIEGALSSRPHRNGNGLEGVLDSMAPKLRRWASERSLRSHMEAYTELLGMPKRLPLLPKLLERLHKNDKKAQDSFIESWGPMPPERYGVNNLSFMVQSPEKAYVHWEWANNDQREYGLYLEDRTTGSRRLLSRGLHAQSDYWVDVQPDHEYVMELAGWDRGAKSRALLRSRPVKTPRNTPSPNKNAVFVDVRNLRRFALNDWESWEALSARLRTGGTSAWEWQVGSVAGSVAMSWPGSFPAGLPK